ncbi:MAG: hypothetical protein ACI3W7_09275 [Oscillospiraceae bacterium]
MNRLTTDTPNGNTENALNLFYIKDMETWVRGGGDAPNHPDVRLVEYIRDIARKHSLNISLDTSDEDLCDELFAILLDGTDTIEGIVATLNTAAWAFSALREKLKKYEDTGLTPEMCAELVKLKGEGRLHSTQCGVGDMVYRPIVDDVTGDRYVSWQQIIEVGTKGFWLASTVGGFGSFSDYTPWSELGKSVFLSYEEAEAALKGGT